MNLTDVYKKYKLEYLELKKIDLNNQIGGDMNNEITRDINNLIEDLKLKGTSKNNIMACVLKKIMDKLKITTKQYMIIAGYCLHKYKDVTDLDVVVQKGKKAYNKLRDSGLCKIDIAKISKDERLILALKNIDENAEIEFFPKARKIGFPSNYYSLENLQSKKLLDYDDYGNPYFNEITCINQYSNITRDTDGSYFLEKYQVSKERVEKNISHLKHIALNTPNKKTKKYCKEKIHLLTSLIK